MLLTLLALSPLAQAAGYYVSDVGPRAYSRGGAFVAGADDITALWYNPAALKRLHDGHLTIDLAGVGSDVTFDRKDYPGEGPDGTDLINEPIENSAPYYLIPHFGGAWSFGLPNTTFAVGFYPPYAPDYAYPQGGPQRYTLVDTVVIQTFTGVSAAHTFRDWVTVGGGVSWNYLYIEQELAVSLWTQTDTERPDYDVDFALDARDLFGVGWNLGLLVEPPSERWAVGLSMQAPVSFSATGTMKADFSENVYYTDFGIIEEPTASDDQVSLGVRMPLIVKAGALYRPVDTLEIELAGVYEGWSSIDEVIVSDVNMDVQLSGLDDVTIEEDIVLPAGYSDAWSLRLGADWDLADRWTLRAGGLFETGAIPAQTLGVGLPDGTKFGGGVGGSVRPLPWLELDLGAFHSRMPTRTITDSQLTQIVVDPLSGDVEDGRVVGDGELSSSVTILGGGVNVLFGELGKR